MKKFKLNKKIIIGLILIMITFASSFLLAKYVSAIKGASNLANIAKWTVNYLDTENHSKSLNLVAGDDDTFSETYTPPTYILKVTSTSETSANYQIILTDVPSAMQIKIDDGEYQTPTDNTMIFEGANYKINITDNDKIKTHTLTFKVPLDSDIDSVNNINIDVKFEQID